MEIKRGLSERRNADRLTGFFAGSALFDRIDAGAAQIAQPGNLALGIVTAQLAATPDPVIPLAAGDRVPENP